MKFIAMAHLLFNTFSVPSALLHYESWAFGVLEDHHTAPSYTFLRTSSNITLVLKEKNTMFITVLSLSTAIVTAYETNTQHDPNNNNAMLGVHASASAIIQYGKIGRKQVVV